MNPAVRTLAGARIFNGAFGLLLLTLVFGAAAGKAVSAITITSPGRGESWALGSSHAITWTYEAPEANVKIFLSTDGGATWIPIADHTPESGRYVWKVSGHSAKSCKIRVAGTESRTFAIIASQEVHTYRWVEVTKQAPLAGRDGAGALVYEDRMWLIGGWNAVDKQHFPRVTRNDVWSSEDGAHWTEVKPNTFWDQSFDANKDWEG
jgi:hypothetical protein